MSIIKKKNVGSVAKQTRSSVNTSLSEKLVVEPRQTRSSAKRSVSLGESPRHKRLKPSKQVLSTIKSGDNFNCNLIPNRNSSIMPDNEGTRAEINELLEQVREERRKLEEERRAFERSQQIEQQNIQSANDREIPPNNHNAPNQRDNGIGGQIVDGLVNHLQYLHINIEIPKFCEGKNPQEFIEDIERYFKFKNVRPEHQMLVIESFIEGRVKVWYQINKHIFGTFEDFKLEFYKEFYSIPVQVRLKDQWNARCYKWKDGSLQSYFFKQIQESKHFRPPLSDYEVNFKIIQQFPNKIQTALAAVDYADTNRVAQTLTQLDTVNREGEFDRNRDWKTSGNQSSSHKNNNVNSNIS